MMLITFMTAFGEELLRQRVWYWLENEKKMVVDGEVTLGTGRIDLVGKTPDGEVWGIEVKTGEYDTEQAHRYVESGKLDRLYIASAKELAIDNESFDVNRLIYTGREMAAAIDEGLYTAAEAEASIREAVPNHILSAEIKGQTFIDYVTRLINGRSYDHHISLEKGVQVISRSASFPELGLIHVPTINLYEDQLPEEGPSPEITESATVLNREGSVEFSRREEPWIRHCIWQKYGGIPEGHIPNVLDSDQPYRPIDLITFKNSNDPADAVEYPDKNTIVGVEAKGEGSFSPKSVHEQLSQFLETESLSQLSLAVPQSLEHEATKLVEASSELSPVEVVTVSEGGDVTTVREGTDMEPKYDGYLENHQERKTGYGDRYPDEARDIISPFITDEEAARLKHLDAIEYARDILSDGPWAQQSQDVGSKETAETPLEERTGSRDGSRIYVLEGTVAAHWEMKSGYVELLVYYYREEDCLLFNFGRNFGGYIWFSAEEIDHLISNLGSLDTLNQENIPGQGYVENSLRRDYDRIGKYLNQPDPDVEYINNKILPDTQIDAESVAEVEIPPQATKSRHSYAAEQERRLQLELISQIDSTGIANPEQQVGTFRLGNQNEGADVEFTYAQWCDLVASIHILREKSGKNQELPEKQTTSWTQSRIAPSGRLIQETDNIDYGNDVIR